MDSEAALALFVRHQRARGLSPRTVKRRSWSLHEWFAHLDPRSFDDATSEDVEDLLMRWPTPQTRRSVHSDLHQFYRFAARRGLVDRDPTADVDAPRVPRRAATPIRPEDVLRAIRAADGPLRQMIGLGAYAGLRVSEIAALHGRDVHFDRGLVVVRQGKGGRDREVPLALELRAMLGGVTTGRLFPEASGGMVSDRIRSHFRRLGIDARPHDLRASFATQLARRANGNVVAVAKLMGHESTATTERYMGWSPETAELVVGLYES